MNYKIVKDEKAFKEFIEWLPELQDGEQFYYCLFARSKYDTTGTLKSDKSQLARGVTTKDRLFGKIKKLEVEIGTYEIDGIPIPENTLALYIHPNPRSMKKASQITRDEINKGLDKGRYTNPKSIALNALQVAKGRSVYVDFDIDYKGETSDYKYFLREWIQDRTGYEHYHKIIETKGGYHVLIEPSQTSNKKWYQEICKNQYVDQKGDLLLPVPGCVQGDFVPHFI